jgi:hypothetical protein
MDPATWLHSWPAIPQVAPSYLDQPILPGWTFNINSNNSSSPQTEASVVAKHSYGRQLGRMEDALELLIEERFGKAPKDQKLADFLKMKHDIDEVKREAAGARLEQIPRDLALLKAQDKKQYARLREELVEALRVDGGA